MTPGSEDTNFAAWNKVNANLEAVAIGFTDTVKGLDYQNSVLDKDLAIPPVAPTEGDRYIVPAEATNDWFDHTNDIAQYTDEAWEFITPNKGYTLFVEDELLIYVWNDVSWITLPEIGGALTGTAGEALDFHDIVYPATDGKYYKAFATGTDVQANGIGIVMQSGGILGDATGQIQVNPLQVIDGDWSWTPNTELFLAIDGVMTHDASSFDWTKPIGYAISATRILFAPQTGWSNNAWLNLSADQMGIEYIPTNYTRTSTPEVTDITQISAHLKGIDDKLAEIIAMIP